MLLALALLIRNSSMLSEPVRSSRRWSRSFAGRFVPEPHVDSHDLQALRHAPHDCDRACSCALPGAAHASGAHAELRGAARDGRNHPGAAHLPQVPHHSLLGESDWSSASPCFFSALLTLLTAFEAFENFRAVRKDLRSTLRSANLMTVLMAHGRSHTRSILALKILFLLLGWLGKRAGAARVSTANALVLALLSLG